jgi:mono/diheme cytochrome c family protein
VAAGCGSASVHGTASAASAGHVFREACSSCHTLTGRNTSVSGGDLAMAKLSVADIESFVRVMPVRLTPAEIAAVSAYVHHAAMAGS